MQNAQKAKEVSDYVKSAVIYQLFLRPFTPEGTLEAATRMLPHVASLGVDIVYLCPQMTADDDPRTEFWSDRQNASKMDNPYSPYRCSILSITIAGRPPFSSKTIRIS